MVSREKVVLLLVLAEIGASVCFSSDERNMPSNRSKIQITIDVASKDEQKGKGKYTDTLTGKIKGIKVFDEDEEGDDYKEVEDKRPDANGLRTTNSIKQDLNKERNGGKKKERTIKHNKQNVHDNERHHLREKKNEENEEKRKEKNKEKAKGKIKRLQKIKTGHHLDRKKFRGNKNEENERHLKKGKNRKKGKPSEKMRTKKKTTNAKHFRMKDRKRGKFVPNPEGSPKPNDLKIPLTFNREDIGNEGNKPFQNAQKTNMTKVNERKIESERSNEDEPNDARKINETQRNGNMKHDKNSTGTGTSWENLNKIKDLTKQIVMATLKEVNNMKNSSISNEMTQTVNNGISNPLLERLVRR